MRSMTAVMLVCTVSAAALLASAAPASGQATNGPAAKSGATAMTIAFFVPGGGHLYAGEPIRGATMFVASTGAAAAALLLSNTINVDWTCEVRDCLDESQNPNYTTLAVGLGAAGVVWLYSLLDAPRAASRANERAHSRLGLLHAVGVPQGVTLEPVAIRTGRTLTPGVEVRLEF